MIKFGTGGFRAVIGEDFTKANLELLAQGLANRIKRENLKSYPVIIGFDRRFLSATAAKWCAGVFAGNGIETRVILEQAPTPLVMFTVKNSNTKYGLAITASHNPAEYNGVKVFTEGGRDASEAVTADIEAEIEKITQADVKLTDYERGREVGIIQEINPKNEYIDAILSILDMDAIKARHPKILFDPMYGVGKTTLQTILVTTRCDIDVIHDRHDPLFGGRLPAPTNDTLRRLSLMVVEGGYDIGIGTDGDADRIGLIDGNGKFIHPNDILVLLYDYLHEHRKWKGPVVRSVATTHLLDKLAESFGERCYEVPVGFKHVSAKMDETNALIGGESSGGLTVRGHIHGKDGIYAAALLVEMLCVIGKPFSAILADIQNRLGRHEMSEFCSRFSTEKKAEIQDILFDKWLLPVFDGKVERVSYADGCKVYFKSGGWIICRFSGTEPLLRIFCEQESMREAEATIRIMRDYLGL
jgi:phosphomannomutase